jgi:Flp pilus assembly protein TadG
MIAQRPGLGLTGNPHQHPRGIATLEFIVVLPFLVFLMLAVVEASRMVLTYNTLVQASRQGARVGAASDPLSITNATAAACNVLLQGNLVKSCPAASGSITVACTPGKACDVNIKDASQVQATVQVTFHSIFPDFVPFLSSIPLSSTTNMAYQYLWTP